MTKMKTPWPLLLATGFKSGYLPKSPGTWGSLAALGPWLFLSALFTRNLISIQVVIAVTTCLLGFWTTKKSLKILNIEANSERDPQIIVIDEWAGLYIALIGCPLNFLQIAVSFALFRLFDIFKPGPIKKVEALGGDTGIMADDIIAGFFALILRLALFYLFL